MWLRCGGLVVSQIYSSDSQTLNQRSCLRAGEENPEMKPLQSSKGQRTTRTFRSVRFNTLYPIFFPFVLYRYVTNVPTERTICFTRLAGSVLDAFAHFPLMRDAAITF